MRVAKSRDVMYGYAGQMWDVPKGFVFTQQTNLKLAWMMWVNGFRGYKTINHDGDRERAPVRPFRDMDPKRLPKNIRRDFGIWYRVLSLMDKEVPTEEFKPELNAAEIDATFEKGLIALKKAASYAYDQKGSVSWGIRYWSTKLTRFVSLLSGTESDKANLPPPSNYTKSKPALGLSLQKKTKNKSRLHIWA